MPDKSQMRLWANVLVTQIVAWGGQGKDMAAFLGVSPTTISHWHNLPNIEGRKPTIPTNEHLLKLIAILKFRIGQNLGRLSAILATGMMDPRYCAILAGEMENVLDGYRQEFGEVSRSYRDGVAETLNGFQAILDKGGEGALRSILGPVRAYWQNSPPEEETTTADTPVDLSQLRAELEIDDEISKKIDSYQVEFRKMIVDQGHSAVLGSPGDTPSGNK